jgi:hypothetical protein
MPEERKQTTFSGMLLITFLESNESKQRPSKFDTHLKCFSFYFARPAHPGSYYFFKEGDLKTILR